MRNNNNETTSIRILKDNLEFKEKMIDINLDLISFYQKQIDKHNRENDKLFYEMNDIYEDIQKINPS